MSRPMSLYIHVPFCFRKCGYCDFYSVPIESAAVRNLLDALLAELDALIDRFAPEVRTVYVGGGTPTALAPVHLARLLGHLQTLLAGHAVAEFTVEANPESVDAERISILAEAGVNRISLGAQSFDPGELAVLQRGHRPPHVTRAVRLARTGGIDNLNLDLIFGIPGQSDRSWHRSLSAALALGPDHLSCYGLTYEPGTPLAARRDRGDLAEPDEETQARQYELCQSMLSDAGFEHYEVSNFARAGCRCLHNLAYWDQQEYLGVGPSAVSYVGGCRRQNVADVDEYCRRVARTGDATEIRERLSGRALAGEAAMLALRTARGIQCLEFADRYGYDPLELFAKAIAQLTGQGLIAVESGRIALTRCGWLLADYVAAGFLADAEEVAG